MGTLNDLSDEELKNFKKFLQLTVFQKDLPDILWMLKYRADRADIVNQMVHTYGQQSVELTREVFMDMNRTDLLQRLSKPSSGLKGKTKKTKKKKKVTLHNNVSANSYYHHWSPPMWKIINVGQTQQKLNVKV